MAERECRSPPLLELPADMLVEILAARPDTYVPLKLTCKRLLELSQRPLAWPYKWIRSNSGYMPLPHQHAAMEWAIGRERRDSGGFLLGGIGRGKTLVMLACLAARRRRTLIVAPIPLIKVWRDELARALPAEQILLFTPNYGRRTPPHGELSKFPVVITSYTMVSDGRGDGLHNKALSSAKFERLILDEVHCGAGSFRLRELIEHSVISNAIIWGLTGTLVTTAGKKITKIGVVKIDHANTYELDAPANGGAAPKCSVTEHVILVPPHNRHIMREAPLVLYISERYHGQTAEVRKSARDMLRAALHALPETATLSIRETPLSVYLQLVTPYARTACVKLRKLVAAIPAEEKVVVFASGGILSKYEAYFQQCAGFLIAPRKSRKRHLSIERFERDPAVRVLVLDYEITEGFNLQFANSVVFLTPPPSERDREQAIGRVCRIGQKRAVHVHYIVHAGTIEERIVREPAAHTEWYQKIR